MYRTNTTQATVISGPHGSSGSPVPPRTPSCGDPASPKEVPVSAPMEPGTPLPPHQGSPTPAPEEQLGSSLPSREQSPSVSLPLPGNEDDPHLPRPILLPSVDSELHAVLRAGLASVPEYSASDRQTLDDSSSAPSSSQPRLLEDERIQSVLNKLHEYASFLRIPLEALFGPEHRKTTPKAPSKDPKVIRANPPPAVPRPSSPDGNLRQFHVDETLRSPVLDTDLLVRSHIAVPMSEEPTSSTSRPHALPKVRPFGTYSNPVPDREDYLPFMKEFTIWSREANGTTPFTSSFRHGLGAPKLDLDLPRAYLKGVNPGGILQFI
ncbi:hypothetical protein RCL1_008984 [Eukaryota sp. TZLM3-RCL]